MTAYRTSGLKICAVLGLVLAFGLLSSSKAEATFIAAICNDEGCNGGGDIIVTDGGVGDGSALAGVISLSGSVGGLTFASNISQSAPMVGFPQPSMDLSFVATGIGEAFLFAYQSSFTVVSALYGTLNGNLSGTGTEQAAILFLGAGTDAETPLLTTSPAFSGTLFTPGASGSPYEMLIGVHVTRTTAGTTTGDFLVTPVPDGGATVGLFGLGLLGVAYVRRRFS